MKTKNDISLLKKIKKTAKIQIKMNKAFKKNRKEPLKFDYFVEKYGDIFRARIKERKKQQQNRYFVV